MKTENHRKNQFKKENREHRLRKKRRSIRRRAKVDGSIEFIEMSPLPRKNIILARMLALVFFLLLFNSSQLQSLSGSCWHSFENGMSKMKPFYSQLTNPRNFFAGRKKEEKKADSVLARKIKKIVKNAPMRAMADDIANRDKRVAAFMVGIAMKESKFGTYSPKKDGAECYNYWGYRGKENTTRSGYSCFDNPKHAVRVVGDRIERLVKDGLVTPEQMIVWKCGRTCAGHSPESVDKWIKDVSIHYYQLSLDKEVAKK